MSLNPVVASRKIFERFCSYITTTFRLNDDELNQQLGQALQEPGRFSRGPILEVTPPFVLGSSVNGLIDENVLTPHLNTLKTEALPLDRPLFAHQEEAIRKISNEGRNVVVATGTGSGKTESFMIPILNHLFAQMEKNELNPGVRALLLYPMNALANDQMKRLRALLRNQPQITFGIYTGETEERYPDAYEKYLRMYEEDPLPNELISREQMKKTPPHILLTNYAMLEYLMLRPSDNVFFQGQYANDWRFIVIDEAHTYTGAKGIEMSMLISRLKSTLRLGQGHLRCMMTSASLGRGREDAALVAKFASDLFRESFADSDVVTATRLDYQADRALTWGKPHPSLYRMLRDWLDDQEKGNMELIEIFRESGVPSAQTNAFIRVCDQDHGQALYRLLQGDGRVAKLIDQLMGGPVDLLELAHSVFGAEESAVDDITCLVELCNQARLREGDNPLLPARFHYFVKALEGAFMTLASPPQIYLERMNTSSMNGEEFRAFELGACTRCHGLYVIGDVTKSVDSEYSYLEQIKNQYDIESNSRLEYFAIVPDGVDEISDTNEDDHLETLGMQLPALQYFLLCARCGGIGYDDGQAICECEHPHPVRVLRVNHKGRAVHKCGLCGARNSRGTVVRRFYLSEDAVSSVLATALYQQIPARLMTTYSSSSTDEDDVFSHFERLAPLEEERTKQLLVFSDSRQNAAFFAPYLTKTYHSLLAKNLLVSTIEANRAECVDNNWTLEDLNARVMRYIKAKGLFPQQSKESLSAEVWRWIMREFAVDTGWTSLENMKLVAFVPNFDPIKGCNLLWTLPTLAQAGFSSDEAQVLYSFLLDQFRDNRAVEYPEEVGPDDPFFAPTDQQGGFWRQKPEGLTRIPPKYSLRGWVPASGRYSNSRLDYILKLLAAGGAVGSEEEAKKVLDHILESLLDPRSPLACYMKSETLRGSGKIYKLDPALYKVVPGRDNPELQYYRCDSCHKVTRFNLRGVCPSYRCNGQLQPIDYETEFQDNHYRHLYMNMIAEPLEAKEHTAQLATEFASEVQTKFLQGKINVLSCSTTFELGVDVGELETIFMKNVPPTPANYAQRAGRAGRRTTSSAYALTYARLASHDFSHFRQPEKMISGVVRPPYFESNNEKIAKRHMYACAFAQFWRKYPEYFRNVDAFFCNGGPRVFRDFLAKRPEGLLKTLQQVIPQALREVIEVDTWKWVDELYAPEGVMTKVTVELERDLDGIEQAVQQASDAADYGRAHRMQRVRNTITSRPLISYLSQKNLLPKYGFPVDVVNLDVNLHTTEAKNIDLSRDMQIAISEYAPEGQVVANGRLWTSRYVKRVPTRELVRYRFIHCSCGYFRKDLDLDEALSPECPVCGNIQPKYDTFVVPEFGFIAEEKPSAPGDRRPERTYSGRKFFSGVSSEMGIKEIKVSGNVYLSTHDHGLLTVINNGLKYGFYLCRTCGYGTLDKRKAETHKNPYGYECKGRFERVSLGYDFETDVVEVDCSSALKGANLKVGYWESLMYAMIEGMSYGLEIDRADIDGTLYVDRDGKRTIILFDTVPGGAGHVKRLMEGDNFTAAMEAVSQILEECNCGGTKGDTSCYGCLRNYQNQYLHDKLRRDYAIDAIGHLLGTSARKARQEDQSRGALKGIAENV